MKVALVTLCLNEMEWLPKLYEQHKDWPGLMQWVFVESADRVYAKTSPQLVSDEGLSVDGTTGFLRELANTDDRVRHIPFGFCTHEDPALCKTQARQQYLNVLEDVRPDFIVVLDADEFYTLDGQEQMLYHIRHVSEGKHMFCFNFTHIWHPPSLARSPLFAYEVVGGFWAMRHMKGFRWRPGLYYGGNHQTPTGPGNWGKMRMYSSPYCIHMAYASEIKTRAAKHRYYEARGEDRDRMRKWYVHSRHMFETWQPGYPLPRHAKVVPYKGPIPEAFQQCLTSPST